MSDIKTVEYMEVCRTGKLHQYYTLYIHKTVSFEGFFLDSYQFIQNLSKEEVPAWDKAKQMLDDRKERMTRAWGKNYFVSMDMVDSPKREYCDLKAFGYEWKKTAKGFITTPSYDFWTIWREHKSALKEAGFSVFKDDRTQNFILFYRNTTQENMIKAFSTLQDKKDNQVITGVYVGEIKERIRDEYVVVKSVYSSMGAFGECQTATFIGEDGKMFRTKYSGSKKIEKDMAINLTGTVVDHKIFDGSKVTVLNRISF